MTTSLASPVQPVSLSAQELTDFSKNRKEPAWLLSLRIEALKNFDALPWPTVKDEHWKRSQLETIAWDKLKVLAIVNGTADVDSPASGQWMTIDQAIVSNPDPVKLAWETAVHRAKTNKFLSLTLAAGRATCLFISKGSTDKVTMPPFQPPFSLSFIFIGEEAHVQIWETLEETVKDQANGPFLSSYTGIHLATNAQASFYHTQRWNDQTVHFQFHDVLQDAGSKLETIAVAVGARHFRNETVINLNGRGSENKVLGVLFGDSHQHFENWITQNHTSPQTTSNIQYRGALKGSANSFFSGLVSITKQAQQSDAYQSSKSLLLSTDARADAIPNLEILADDVKCSHGAAVGPVDEDQKYYLQTRGVKPGDAEEIIVQGFFEPVIAEVPSQTVQEKLRQFVEEKLNK